MLKNIVEKYVNDNYNCSESILRAMNEYYQLGIDEHGLKVASGFGGGLYSGDVCGCLTGAIMAMSVMLVEDKSNTTPNFKDEIRNFYQAFLKEYGSTNCCELRATQRHPQLGCKELMIRVGDFIETYNKK